MQLLLTYPSTPSDWDAHAEARAQAGLTQLQLWTDTDSGATLALFTVSDRAKAQAWLDNQRGLGAKIEARFLRTA